MNDATVRWQTYYAIYRDPFLSRYAPGGGLLWGHRHPFSGAFMPFGPARFPGTEPAGDYPIHVIVKNGRITLLGVVDTQIHVLNVLGRCHGTPARFLRHGTET
ncbi:MAG TPA: BON domain-containing protein [Vicinamibacterales bacterium]|nr:BON domain-containing protein [Vicinamibacterales bacterium]